jgi:hypothetical protein
MANRPSLSKGTRFKVFTRDEFTCVYCGRKAPFVRLEVDHRVPRCAGGGDSFGNLVTACWDCNRGKAGRDLGADYFASFVPTELRLSIQQAHDIAFMAALDEDGWFDGWEPEDPEYDEEAEVEDLWESSWLT